MPRDTGWSHFRFIGNEAAGRAYIPAARDLLGFVRSQAASLKLQTYQVTNKLENGVVLTAELIGGIPRMTIEVPVEQGKNPTGPGMDGFVVIARNEALPDGIGGDHPQQIIRETESDGYKTHTYSGSEDGARSDGTYRVRFPSGIEHAGNVDWVSSIGERLSWYGPSARMFMDPYVNPSRQFGKFVFMLGQPLLDTEAYLAESDLDPGFDDRHILGAAIRSVGGRLYLYTVQGVADDGITDMTDIPDGQGRISYPLAEQASNGGIHRYRLVRYLGPGQVMRYRVAKNSREKLINLNVGHSDPWYFNQSATELICHAAMPPDLSPTWYAAQLFDPVDPPDGSDVVSEFYPSPAQRAYRLGITEAGIVSLGNTDLSVESGEPAAAVFSDYEGDTLRSYGIRLDADMVPFLVFDGTEIPLWRIVPEGDDLRGTKRWIVYASPRDHVLITLHSDLLWEAGSIIETPGNTLRGEGVKVEVWRYGVLVSSTLLYTPSAISEPGFNRHYRVTDEAFNSLIGQPIAPHFYLYGVNFLVTNTATDGMPNSHKTLTNMIGAAMIYGQLPYPAECYFGTYDLPTDSGDPDRPPTPVSERALGGFAGSRPDADGHFSVVGCAASAANLLVSFAVAVDDGDQSFFSITDDTFSIVTGIGGTNARYHPIWVLGKPPNAPQETP